MNTIPVAGKKLVLTSVNQLIAIIRSNPGLVQSIPRFANMQNAEPSTAPKKSCNCGAKQNITTPDVNKQMAENILSSLTTDEFLKIKSILGYDQLCYYKRENTKLEMVCL